MDQRGPKASATIPPSLPGSVQSQYVRCKKPNCRCGRGDPHGPYWYLFILKDHKLTKRYIRLSEVATVKGLVAGKYDILVDGRSVGTFSSDQLAGGVNLSSATSDGWQPGGPLVIEWRADNHILMTGPVELEHQGVLDALATA